MIVLSYSKNSKALSKDFTFASVARQGLDARSWGAGEGHKHRIKSDWISLGVKS